MSGTLALRLTGEQYRAVLAHCHDGLPDEACGMLAGTMQEGGEPTGIVTEVYPCRNADNSASTYTVDSRDLMKAMRAAEARGDELIGVWHSHTHTLAYPSPTDVRQAADPSWVYAIVSLEHEEPEVRAFRIRSGEIEEIPVVLGDA